MYDIKYSKFTAKSFIRYIEYNDKGLYLNSLNIIVKDVNNNIKQYDYNTFKYKFTFKPFDYIRKKHKTVLYDKIPNNNYNIKNTEVIKYDLITTNSINYYDNKEIGYVLNESNNNFIDMEVPLFNGIYYPIFNKIEFVFNNNISTDLKYFGIINEMLISKKVDVDTYSINNLPKIFPLLDYIGVSVETFNIFKSQFDLMFYKKYIKK